MASFDNMEDVQTKFNSTICYYKNKPVIVKNSFYMEDHPDQYELMVATLNGKGKRIPLVDPEFNYTRYNIGYCNAGKHAFWWFRRPLRQYSQGLKGSQVGWLSSNPAIIPQENFTLNRPVSDMLENNYPDIDEIAKPLRDGQCSVLAFHKDFAVSWDNIHKDFILEYRGVQIGSSLSNTKFKLTDEFQFLTETLQEAIKC